MLIIYRSNCAETLAGRLAFRGGDPLDDEFAAVLGPVLAHREEQGS